MLILRDFVSFVLFVVGNGTTKNAKDTKRHKTLF